MLNRSQKIQFLYFPFTFYQSDIYLELSQKFNQLKLIQRVDFSHFKLRQQQAKSNKSSIFHYLAKYDPLSTKRKTNQIMKKFKKPLLINVPEDDHNQVKSPSHFSYKETKERSLLLYNQHTVTSSANNEDELAEEDDRQQVNCQQFIEFNVKDCSNKKQQIQQQQGQNKLQKQKKFHVIQFEEFSVETDKTKDTKQNSSINYSSIYPYQKKQIKNHKKQFSIEIPEIQVKIQNKQTSAKFAFDSKAQNTAKSLKQNFMKEPPGPSNKAKLSKTLNRQFVFPTTDEQNLNETLNKKGKQTEKAGGKFIPQEQHQAIIKALQQQWIKKLQAVKKSFQKERQQFYRQKSSMQKDLMIKDGQIQMLQKLITNRYQSKEGNTNNNYGNIGEKRQSVYKESSNPDKTKSNFYLSDEKINAMERILLEKDLEINTLMEKINELNTLLDRKNYQLEEVKINLIKIQKMNESLRNDIFIHEKKDQSQKLTKQFYKVKQSLIQVQQSVKTPKGFSRSKWQQDGSLDKQKSKESQKSDYPMRGIDDLHKRLESLKMNRIELQSRGRIKSEIGYPLTSKNRTKGAFDFKGKIYDRERDYISRGIY